MTHPVAGVDHAFLLTDDLDGAARAWAAMGFTVSPRGLHSAAKGTANHTVMFPHDYLELLGVVSETPGNAARRRLLAEAGPGLRAVACRVGNARAAEGALRELGLATGEYGEFSRPVDLPEGGTGEAAFATLAFAPAEVPAGEAFLCEHRTREMVWRPELLEHPNGAVGLAAIVAVASEPESAARRFARLFATGAVERADGGFVVRTGARSAPILVADPDGFARSHPGQDLAATPGDAFAAVHVRVADPGRTREALRRGGVPHSEGPSGLLVGPEAAGGTVLAFVAAGAEPSDPG